MDWNTFNRNKVESSIRNQSGRSFILSEMSASAKGKVDLSSDTNRLCSSHYYGFLKSFFKRKVYDRLFGLGRLIFQVLFVRNCW